MRDSKLLFDAGLASDATAVEAQQGDGLLQIFWRQRNIFLSAVCLGILLALLWLGVAPRLYRSTASFSIIRGSSGQSPDSRAASSDAASDLMLSQRERMVSRTVLALALSRPDTKNLPTWKRATSPLSYLRQHISVSADRGNYFSVSVDTPFPDDSKTLADAVVKSFAQYQVRPEYSSVANALSELSLQQDRAQQHLADVTSKMRAIELKFGALANSDQASAALAELPQITQQLGAAKLDTIKARSDYEDAVRSAPAASGPASPLPSAMLPHQEADVRQELIAAQARMVELRQHYLPEHPSIAAQQRRIDILTRSYAGSLKQKLESSQRRELALQTAFDQQQLLAIQVSASTAEYARLKFEADRMHRQLDSLDARAAAIQLARDATAITVDFDNEADTGVISSPQTSSVVLVGILGGLAAGAGLSLVRERLDDRLRSSEAARKALGLPVLGAIPAMPSGISSMLAAQRVTFDPGSEVADAFRAIRAAIRDTAPEDRRRAILITSAAEGDGKTTCSTNLAIAMAQGGSRVLLIDANLRKPTLHTIFGIRQSVGLAALLAGRGTPARAIQPTTTKQLSLLPSGPSPSNPTELLNSPALPKLIETLADMFDHIIIDGPAMTGEVDARILAVACDLTLLVVRADATGRRQALVARDGLIGVGASVLGLIVTMASHSPEKPEKTALRSALDEMDETEAQPTGA